jgi:hypothetical protein
VNADRPIVPLIPTPEASVRGCCDVDLEENGVVCNVCTERCAGAADAVAGAVCQHSCAVTAVWERRREGAEELPGDGNNAFGFKGLLMKANDEVLDAPVWARARAGVKIFDTSDSAARCDVAF